MPKPHIIPMGVDVKRFHSGERTKLRRELPENEFLILFVGRLLEDKGLTDLLSALTLLPLELRCKTTLWVVGDWQYRTRLQKYAETLGISEKVRFWGSISNQVLPHFYAAADLFVAPSEAIEGLGVVLLEALAASLCVIATRVGGISEVVEDGHTGVLVEPRATHTSSPAPLKIYYPTKSTVRSWRRTLSPRSENIMIGRKSPRISKNSPGRSYEYVRHYHILAIVV